MNKRTLKIMGFAFPVILILVMIVNIILPDKAFSEEENRVLQEQPSFGISAFLSGRFEQKTEAYAEDQFLFRNAFIKIKTAADTAFGVTRSNGVYRGRNGYLLEDVTVPDREALVKTLATLADFRASNPDTNMTFMLAPNAANILEDNLPLFARTADQDFYMDALFGKLKLSGYDTVDVRDVFREKSEEVQLYYRTDHHWTTDGAYLAYREYIRSAGIEDSTVYEPLVVKNDFRGTLASKSGFTNGKNDALTIYLPTAESSFEPSVIFYPDTTEKTTMFYRLDNLETKDAYTVFGGSNPPIYTIKTPLRDNEQCLLLIKDSYANSMIPFLAQDYYQIVVIDPRYFYDNVSTIIDTYGVTDVLFLYNANTFFADNSLEMVLRADMEQPVQPEVFRGPLGVIMKRLKEVKEEAGI
ncbi:MAG: hypothetical protein K5774_01760 [Clostridia bacterium]|nr:hypothetical protein [Clostridia bacterium]